MIRQITKLELYERIQANRQAYCNHCSELLDDQPVIHKGEGATLRFCSNYCLVENMNGEEPPLIFIND